MYLDRTIFRELLDEDYKQMLGRVERRPLVFLHNESDKLKSQYVTLVMNWFKAKRIPRRRKKELHKKLFVLDAQIKAIDKEIAEKEAVR